MLELLQRTLEGLLEAGPYALIGLGLTISFGVLRKINLAFGATALLAAYVGSWLHVRWGVPALGVWVAVILITVLVGFYVEWICFDIADESVLAMRRQSSVALGLDAREASVLAASFALWMQIEQVAVNFQPNHLHPFPDLSSKLNFDWGGIDLRPDRIFVFFLAIGLIAGLTIWLKNSQLGLGIRALSSSQAAAQVCGLNVLRLRYIGTAVSCALCGVASCAVLSMDGQVTPMFGMWVLLKGLTCALLGGLGSVRGVLGGAVLLGITEAHAQSLWGPIGRDAATWGLLLLALLFQTHLLKHKFFHAKKV
jgi:branched-subunit amino acid ABC-type transport system permease component